MHILLISDEFLPCFLSHEHIVLAQATTNLVELCPFLLQLITSSDKFPPFHLHTQNQGVKAQKFPTVTEMFIFIFFCQTTIMKSETTKIPHLYLILDEFIPFSHTITFRTKEQETSYNEFLTCPFLTYTQEHHHHERLKKRQIFVMKLHQSRSIKRIPVCCCADRWQIQQDRADHHEKLQKERIRDDLQPRS